MPESAKKAAAKKAAPSVEDTDPRHPEDDLSYEDAREALTEVVHALEQGGTTLAESIDLWERGERLARTCQRWLDGARERLDSAIEREADD
ncbi:exodeoxyribonuclease 7 small subunit [Marmoricola endophyticus]|uniref:Exodeoxyribonuclease 7 small subunit n=1 Tax=Marmoricola endophyticus TaxID=2040280 RepID=A0A917BU23_9ACTN|nr:exodeoxyribonuclease VII small subunit [Marmoricola endophyticus]GGF54450.1 exodeoxyribonuclease 7 small subunit [Marmoricola endophyticus]